MNISSRLLLAAYVAEQAALSANLMSNIRQWDEIYDFTFVPHLYKSQRHLLAASSPNHWEEVAGLLRGIVVHHQPVVDDEEPAGPWCSTCMPITVPYPCPTVSALLPLADQIIRDLGTNPDE